jgi:ABC-2 type transport system permease protein
MKLLQSRYGTLLRREFWENRSLWISPAAAAGFLLLGCIVLALRAGGVSAPIDIQIGGSMRDFGGAERGFEASAFVTAALVIGIGSISALMYAFDALYSERRDRSILFWKSLPVSDRETVLAKLAVAALVMPVALYFLAVLTHLVGGAILSLHPPGGMPVRQMWQPGVMANTYGTLAIVVFTNMLWLLPVISYALLASVIAKRSPLLTGLLPLVIAAAVERVVFGSTFLAGFLRERFMLVPGPEALATPGLWLGLAVAAGILYIVIRLRRYRDDS